MDFFKFPLNAGTADQNKAKAPAIFLIFYLPTCGQAMDVPDIAILLIFYFTYIS
jgi:hypothetical protein